MIQHLCDRCKKLLPEMGVSIAIRWAKIIDSTRAYELCKECGEEFYIFLSNKPSVANAAPTGRERALREHQQQIIDNVRKTIRDLENLAGVE